jgi:hypothetical protein
MTKQGLQYAIAELQAKLLKELDGITRATHPGSYLYLRHQINGRIAGIDLVNQLINEKWGTK